MKYISRGDRGGFATYSFKVKGDVFAWHSIYVWVVATQICFIFTPILGEMIQFDGSHIFSNGLVQPSTRYPP